MNAIELLLKIIDEGFDRKSWHGTNLRGSIRGLTAEEAAWRPRPARKNINEIVLHCAYWKYTVHRRLCREKRGGFSLKSSNWFERPSNGVIDETAWKIDVKLLEATHGSLREAIAKLKASQLGQPVDSGSTTTLQLVTGIVTVHGIM